jgi:transposase InsO family protein
VGGRYRLPSDLGWVLYLAKALEALSRKVAGWAMQAHLRAELALTALNMALGQRRPNGRSITPTRAASIAGETAMFSGAISRRNLT